VEETPLIDINALTAKGERLGSDTVFIATIAKTRTPRQRDLFQDNVSHVSHKHGANIWGSKQQTNIKIITPRQEVINAFQKRRNNLTG
jgi:thioredoxin reductase